MSQQTINGYQVGHTRGVLTLTKEGKMLRFTIGEVEPLRQLVNIALGMQTLPALPPQISNGRWSVTFNENDTLALSADDGREGALSFNWNDGDELILTLDAAQAIALNAIKLGHPL
jgi:hypothetical protein